MTANQHAPGDARARPAIPHRKVIRSWLAPIASPSTVRALALVLLDVSLLAASSAAVVLTSHPLV